MFLPKLFWHSWHSRDEEKDMTENRRRRMRGSYLQSKQNEFRIQIFPGWPKGGDWRLLPPILFSLFAAAADKISSFGRLLLQTIELILKAFIPPRMMNVDQVRIHWIREFKRERGSSILKSCILSVWLQTKAQFWHLLWEQFATYLAKSCVVNAQLLIAEKFHRQFSATCPNFQR